VQSLPDSDYLLDGGTKFAAAGGALVQNPLDHTDSNDENDIDDETMYVQRGHEHLLPVFNCFCSNGHSLVDHLDRVSRKCSLLINVDMSKVMASDDIACRILIQNEQLEQVDTFPYYGSLITEDGECTTELNGGQTIGASLQKIWKSCSIPPGERDNARNNASCMQVRNTTHGLNG